MDDYFDSPDITEQTYNPPPIPQDNPDAFDFQTTPNQPACTTLWTQTQPRARRSSLGMRRRQ